MTEREKFISWVLGLKDSNGEYLYGPAKLRSEFVDGAWQFSCIQVAAMWQGWLSAHQAHTSTQHRAALEECVGVLKKHEWWEVHHEYHNNQYVCIECDKDKRDGHLPDCTLAAAITHANQVLEGSGV